VDATLEEMDHVINLNIRGVFVTTQAALKHMNENGRIIMIGSCVGERNPTPGLAAYSATKGAVKMFAQSLSTEVGSRGITVNNVRPGPSKPTSILLWVIGQRLKSGDSTQPIWSRR
jgi:3-oxoacyl-[acyl-carrier protein] reductase